MTAAHRRPLLRVSAILALTWPLRAEAQRSQLSPQELHDRIVAVLMRNTPRPVPAGDTFVTWSPSPNLYTTVSRSPNEVSSSLIRVDTLVGTEDSRWQGTVQTAAEVRWTKADSSVLVLHVSTDGVNIHFTGAANKTMPYPGLPWVVADYGMDDQMLPLYESLHETTRVAIYRPFPAKWDTVSVSVMRTSTALLVSEVDPDGEVFHWIVSPAGQLVRITRSKYPDFERRPLEQTSAMAVYVRLRSAGGP